MTPPQVLPQLPRVFHAPGATDMLVAAEHNDGREAMVRRLVGVPETELERVLCGEERHDMRSCQFRTEVRHQMAKVVFFLRPDRTIRDHHADVLARERSDRVIGIDPGVDALGRLQFCARRTEFHRYDGRSRCAEEGEKRGQLPGDQELAGLKPGPLSAYFF